MPGSVIVCRADLAVEKRLEPLFLLLGRAHPLEHLHVAGVGCRAVEALGGEPVLAELDRDVRVVEVRQADAGLRVRQEEVPQPELAGLGLRTLEQLELPGRPAPPIGAVLAEPVELLGDRLDLLCDELLHGLVERADALGHPQVEVVHARRLQRTTSHAGHLSSWPLPGRPLCAPDPTDRPPAGRTSADPAHRLGTLVTAVTGVTARVRRARGTPRGPWSAPTVPSTRSRPPTDRTCV